jgi:hypothetical protein
MIKWTKHPGHWMSECERYQLLPVGRTVDSTVWQAFRYNKEGEYTTTLGVRVTPELAAELCYLDAGGQ